MRQHCPAKRLTPMGLFVGRCAVCFGAMRLFVSGGGVFWYKGLFVGGYEACLDWSFMFLVYVHWFVLKDQP